MAQNPIEKSQRIRWTEAEYAELLYCYFYQQHRGTASENNVYNFWRTRNPLDRLNLTSKTLASQRRYIINNKKLSELEIDRIKQDAQPENFSLSLSGSLSAPSTKNPRSENSKFSTTTVSNHELDNIEPQPCTPNRMLYQNDALIELDHSHIDVQVTQLQDEIEREYNIVRASPVYNRLRLRKLWENTKTKQLITVANNVLQLLITHNTYNLTELNNLIYATATVITNKILQPQSSRTGLHSTSRTPKWKHRLEKRIANYRAELSIIASHTALVNESSKKKLTKLKQKYSIQSDHDYINTQELLKQKILLYAQRIRRYVKRTNFYQQNRTFIKNEKQFYRNLHTPTYFCESGPTLEKQHEFWQNLWGNAKVHNQTANWIVQEELRTQKVPFMEFEPVNVSSLRAVLSKLSNWKAPGPDCVPNFWIKKLHALHLPLACTINQAIHFPETCPTWLTRGTTILLPKTANPTDPSEYRPITCLSVFYKLITSVLVEQIYDHLQINHLLPAEQKGCGRGTYGCREHLLLNKLIIDHARKNSRNLAMAWIDYRKAYDSVPHSWIEHTLKLYHLDPDVVNFCVSTMRTWQTRIHLQTPETCLQSKYINIRRGIFQGDSLSPLLFCIILIPLSREIKASQQGYHISDSVTIDHLLYMDDLKLYAKNKASLEKLLKTVYTISNDIHLSLNISKCSKAIFHRGRLTDSTNIVLDFDTEIRDLQPNRVYKYLGVDERNGIETKLMKDRVRLEYYRRVRRVLNSELTSGNKFRAIGSLAVPVIEYSISILDWTKTELQKIDRKTRKILTMNKLLHPRADVSRLYVPRSEGGRGLRQIEATYKLAQAGFAHYLNNCVENPLVDLIKKVASTSRITSTPMTCAEKITADYHLTLSGPSAQSRTLFKSTLKAAIIKNLRADWVDKPMHGQFARQIQRPGICLESSFRWLKTGHVKGETEALIVAAQDQALRTRYFDKNILHAPIDGKCRLCRTNWETIDHVVSGCSVLAQKEYIHRHDRICTYLHYSILKHFGFSVPDKWYTHVPAAVTQIGEITVLYNEQVHTDRTIPANKPDIIVRNNTQRTCQIIEVAVPMDINVEKKEVEKNLKYVDLSIEISRMWQMKVEIIPIVIGALGTSTFVHQKNLKKLGPQLSSSILQNIVLYGTAHILRRTLMCAS